MAGGTAGGSVELSVTVHLTSTSAFYHFPSDTAPEMICLIYDKDLMPNMLCTQKAVKIRGKFQQLIKPVAERNNNCHAVFPP